MKLRLNKEEQQKLKEQILYEVEQREITKELLLDIITVCSRLYSIKVKEEQLKEQNE